MDNTLDQINQVLNDPESMKQIQELAAVLMDSQTTTAENAFPSQLPLTITRALHKAQEKDAKHQALVRALIPYLQPHRQQKLQQALEIAKLSYLANAALSNEFNTPIKEGANDL